jgi:hypothetical protein
MELGIHSILAVKLLTLKWIFWYRKSWELEEPKHPFWFRKAGWACNYCVGERKKERKLAHSPKTKSKHRKTSFSCCLSHVGRSNSFLLEVGLEYLLFLSFFCTLLEKRPSKFENFVLLLQEKLGCKKAGRRICVPLTDCRRFEVLPYN